ncbi:MAG: carbohydrate kinase [Oscillospiraceae bacterium]|nr:carbohydrate kinase [Oscillospiraceae bacterium]
MTDMVALGELIIDFAPKGNDKYGYPLLQAQAGGAPANLLSAFCKYGGTGVMIGKVGADAFGDLMVKSLKSIGADVRGVIQDDKYFTTMAFVTLDEKGDRSFSFARKPGADVRFSFDEIDLSLIDEGKIFHFSTLSLTDEPGRTATLKCAEYAKEKGKLISYDPNLRLNLWKNEADAKEYMLKGLEFADIVKISDNEVDFLWGCDEKTGAEKILNEFGAKLVYVTLGPKGCYFCNRSGSGYVDAPSGLQAVDTTGAGDIFGGSAMSQFIKLGKMPDELTTEELTSICRFATTAATLSTLENGGFTSVPDVERVLEILNR